MAYYMPFERDFKRKSDGINIMGSNHYLNFNKNKIYKYRHILTDDTFSNTPLIRTLG